MRAAEGKTEELHAARVFVFYENWLSVDHHDAHFAAPHLAGVLSRAQDLLDHSGFTIHRVRRIA